MKKMILFALAMLMAFGVMAQKQGYFLVYNIATSTTPTTEYIKKGSYVMIMNDTTLYLSKINIGRGSTMAATLLASGSNHAIINRAIFGGKAITFFVDTVNAQNVYGVKSFKNNATFAGTLGVTGATSFTGAITAASTLGVTGNLGVGTTAQNKFTVAGTTGNTVIAGTLGVTGKVTGADTVQTAVLKSTGMTLSTGDFKVNTNKFTVAASSGNTVIAGTLAVTGTTTTGSVVPVTTRTKDIGSSTVEYTNVYSRYVTTSERINTPYIVADSALVQEVKISVSDTTVHPVVGKLVIKGTDLYICKSTSAAKKWYKITTE